MSDSLNIQEVVEITYEKYASVHDGHVATYIPELGKANPDTEELRNTAERRRGAELRP